MSTHNFEENSDPDWRILVNAAQRAPSDEDQQQKSTKRPVISYEQFLEELKQGTRGPNGKLTSTDAKEEKSNDGDVTNNNNNNNAGEIFFSLGDWISEDDATSDDDNDECTVKDENYNYFGFRQRGKRKHNYNTSGKLNSTPEKNESWSDTSSSTSSSRNDGVNPEGTHVYSDEENCWESLSSSSDDKDFDDFIKNSKSPVDDGEKSHIRCMPYSNLTECLFRQYYPESSYPSQNNARKFKDYNKNFEKHGQLSLEERLPLMQVIDALEDVNKVLKKGKITPNIERILEYKQDYPFTEGYEEEELGWCPYIVYRIEKFFKKISSKQWPY